MRPANQTTESRAIRYAIGAGISVLALMLFSQLSCSIMGYCADWFGIPVLGFWEVLGIATALLFSYLAIRLLLRPRLADPVHPVHPVHGTAQFEISDPVDTSVQEVEARREATIPERTRERWQAFCERLSDEEKRSLRSVLEKRVISSSSTGSDAQPD